MGLFSKSPEEERECKLCNRTVDPEKFNDEFGICLGCLLILNSKVESIASSLQFFQEKANASLDPSEKIIYLRSMLDLLYEYKVKYYDNDVNVLEQDVEDLIDEVIDCIAEARL